MGDVSAIDDDVAAGHERGARGHEECDDFRDLFRRPEPADRRARKAPTEQVRLALQTLLVELGENRPGAHGMHEYALGTELVGHRAREMDEPRLRRSEEHTSELQSRL